ncbi:MAG: CdaR family protein [Thermoanaerobaculia bacterium]
MPLPRFLVRNLGSKLLALAIAVAVWFSLSGERRERTSERSYHIPLSIVNIPPRSLIASPMPASVDVRLRGPFTALRQLEPEKLEAVMDLSDAQVGERVYRLTPEDVNVPPDVEVIALAPQEIRFLLDTGAEREIPIAPVVTGEPAAGMRVAQVRADPALARVAGPAGALSRMTSIATVPVSVAGREKSFSTPAAVLAAGPGLRVRERQVVTVTVALEPQPPPPPTPGPARRRRSS